MGHSLVYGSWFNLGSVHGFIHGLVYGTWFVLKNVLLEHGGLPFIFPSISTLTLDTIATLSGT